MRKAPGMKKNQKRRGRTSGGNSTGKVLETRVWNMRELSEAGALGEGRKKREARGVSRSAQEPAAGVPHL